MVRRMKEHEHHHECDYEHEHEHKKREKHPLNDAGEINSHIEKTYATREEGMHKHKNHGSYEENSKETDSGIRKPK